MTTNSTICHGAVVPVQMDIFAEDGTFEGYATVYNVPIERPFGGHVIMDKGLFSDSIKDKGAKEIRMLWQHNPDEPIGVYTEFSEDERGVRVKGRLLVNEIERAKEVHALMKNNAIGGLSVGFSVVESETDKKTGNIHYTKGDLWEVSAVTFPANTQAKIDRVHNQNFEMQGVLEALNNLNLIIRGE